jgi:hypothetical protein
VRARRTEPAAAAPIIEPPARNRRGRICDQRHVLHQRERPGLADRTLRDRARDERAIRGPAELVADEMRHSCALCRGKHALRLVRVERERLLADDVPAGLARLDREGCVRVGRCGNGDRVDAFDLERVTERCTCSGYSESVGATARARRAAANQRVHGEARRPERGDVHPAAEAGADDHRARH